MTRIYVSARRVLSTLSPAPSSSIHSLINASVHDITLTVRNIRKCGVTHKSRSSFDFRPKISFDRVDLVLYALRGARISLIGSWRRLSKLLRVFLYWLIVPLLDSVVNVTVRKHMQKLCKTASTLFVRTELSIYTYMPSYCHNAS